MLKARNVESWPCQAQSEQYVLVGDLPSWICASSATGRVARSEGKGEVNRPVFQLQLAALLQEKKPQSQSIVSDGVSRFPGHCMTCLTQLSVQAPPESALFASSLGPLVISIAVSATRADLMRSLAYGPIYSPAPGRVIHQVKGQRASLGG